MTMALTNKALTLLATVKTELGVTVTTDDDYLRRLINKTSDYIYNYCNRDFRYQTVTDERQPGKGGPFLFVDVFPIVTLTSVYYNDTEVTATEYEIHKADAGSIYKIEGEWEWTAKTLTTIEYDALPGTERKLYDITYIGGYVLPITATAASITGTQDETFTFTSDLIITTELGATTVALNGLSTQSASDVVTLIEAAFAAEGDEVTASISGTTKVKLTHNGNDSTNVITVTDNNAATVLGLSTTQAAGDRTLPWDLEQACIDMVTNQYKTKGMNSDIKSEKVLSGSQSFFGEFGLTTKITQVLDAYRRFV